MTRTEKLIIGVTVVVLGIGSMALMWTSRQVGAPVREETVVREIVSVPTSAPVAAPRPSNLPPPPPPMIPVAQAAPQQDTSGGVAPQPANVAAAQVAPVPTDGVQPSDQERTDQREQRNAAVRSLQAVEAQLATGNTDGVDEVLSNTGEQLDEPARGAVTAARRALENKDLTLARAEVIRAIAATPSR